MIPAELIRKIRRIEIRTNRLVNDVLAGEYHSVFKGLGMEFSEVREYQVGDDVRSIDWNVTARMGHPFVKRYREERELTVMFLVDASSSEEFGTQNQTKGEVAAEMTALLAFSAIKNNDRVGLIIFTDRIERYIPPKKGKNHVLRLIGEILSFRPQGRQTNIAAGLEYLRAVQKRKCVAFLISDFLDRECETQLRLVNQRHDLIAVSLADPREETLPQVMGFFEFEDAETGEIVTINLADTGAVRAFQAHAENENSELETRMRRLGVGYIPVRTDRDYVPPLVRFFEQRASRY